MDLRTYNLVEQLVGGVNVLKRRHAEIMRLKEAHPEWIEITEPQGEIGPEREQPICGAIVTEAGIAAMQAARESFDTCDECDCYMTPGTGNICDECEEDMNDFPVEDNE